MTSPTAALLIIGNEILSGRTQDKNLKFLAEELGKLGIRFLEARVVPDLEHRIISAVQELSNEYTHLFTTGGIGPTHDDITTQSIAKAFHKKVIRHPEAEQRLRIYYKDNLNDARLKMANIPEEATLIENPISAAPGFQIQNVFVLAGVPNIMQAMFFALRPQLAPGKILHSRDITAYLSESAIALGLETIQQTYPETDIGSYPFMHDGVLGVTLVVRGEEEEKVIHALTKIEELIREIGGNIGDKR